MATSLRSTLTHLANTFASSVLAALRQASLQEILAETGGLRQGPGRPRSNASLIEEAIALSKGSKASRANGKGASVAAGAKTKAKTTTENAARLPRRTEGDISNLVDRIVTLLERKPMGLRAEQIRAALRLEAKELPRPIADALAAKRIVKEGQKRATTYFARGAAKRS